jgi:hypothetical protein
MYIFILTSVMVYSWRSSIESCFINPESLLTSACYFSTCIMSTIATAKEIEKKCRKIGYYKNYRRTFPVN